MSLIKFVNVSDITNEFPIEFNIFRTLNGYLDLSSRPKTDLNQYFWSKMVYRVQKGPKIGIFGKKK